MSTVPNATETIRRLHFSLHDVATVSGNNEHTLDVCGIGQNGAIKHLDSMASGSKSRAPVFVTHASCCLLVSLLVRLCLQLSHECIQHERHEHIEACTNDVRLCVKLVAGAAMQQQLTLQEEDTL